MRTTPLESKGIVRIRLLYATCLQDAGMLEDAQSQLTASYNQMCSSKEVDQELFHRTVAKIESLRAMIGQPAMPVGNPKIAPEILVSDGSPNRELANPAT